MRNSPELSGSITSEEEFVSVIELALRTYQSEELKIALRRIGKGICPKSFPVSPQSFYFLDLFGKTHGGEGGVDIRHLPNDGGVLDQPNIFWQACDAIRPSKIAHYNKKLENVGKDTVHREANTGAGNPGSSNSSFSG